MAELSEKYDCLIIDSAPIIAVTDAVILSRMVDGVVLVTNKRTARQQVKTALSRLEYAGAKVFGVVLNQIDPRHFGYNSSYRGNYYNNGDKRKASRNTTATN